MGSQPRHALPMSEKGNATSQPLLCTRVTRHANSCFAHALCCGARVLHNTQALALRTRGVVPRIAHSKLCGGQRVKTFIASPFYMLMCRAVSTPHVVVLCVAHPKPCGGQRVETAMASPLYMLLCRAVSTPHVVVPCIPFHMFSLVVRVFV